MILDLLYSAMKVVKEEVRKALTLRELVSGELEALTEGARRAVDQPEADEEAGHGMNSHHLGNLRVEVGAEAAHMVVAGTGVPAGVNNRTGVDGGNDGPENAADNIGVDAESGVDAGMDGVAAAVVVHLGTQAAVHKEQAAEVALLGWHTVLEGHMAEHGGACYEVARLHVEAGSRTTAVREAAASGLHNVHGVHDPGEDSQNLDGCTLRRRG